MQCRVPAWDHCSVSSDFPRVPPNLHLCGRPSPSTLPVPCPPPQVLILPPLSHQMCTVGQAEGWPMVICALSNAQGTSGGRAVGSSPCTRPTPGASVNPHHPWMRVHPRGLRFSGSLSLSSVSDLESTRTATSTRHRQPLCERAACSPFVSVFLQQHRDVAVTPVTLGLSDTGAGPTHRILLPLPNMEHVRVCHISSLKYASSPIMSAHTPLLSSSR